MVGLPKVVPCVSQGSPSFATRAATQVPEVSLHTRLDLASQRYRGSVVSFVVLHFSPALVRVWNSVQTPAWLQ